MTKLKPSLALLLVALLTTATFGQSETTDEIAKLRAQLREEKDARVELERKLLQNVPERSTLTNRFNPGKVRATNPAIGVPLDRPVAVGIPLPPSNNRTLGFAQRPQATTVGSPFGFFDRSESEVSKLFSELKASKDDTEKEALKSELKEALEKQYDDYLTRLEAPLKQMEARVEKLRAEFTKRQEVRNELVKHRLDNLWYQANGMSWPSEGSTNRFPTAWHTYGPSTTPALIDRSLEAIPLPAKVGAPRPSKQPKPPTARKGR